MAQTDALAAPARKKPTPAPAVPAPPIPTEPDFTAIAALNALPKEVLPNLARIEGPEGRPFPERWYILVHDASQPRGLREFVVAQGKLLTGRMLSQFADSVSAEDVLGAANVKINSDQVAGVAAQFAMHNSVQLGTIHYELLKATAPAVPVWRLTCKGREGDTLGTIVIHAGKGALLSYQGFEKSPIVPEPTAAEEAPTATPTTTAAAARDNVSEQAPKKKTTASRSPAATERGGLRSSNAPTPRAQPVRQTSAPRQSESQRGIGGFFRRVFRE